MRAMEPADVAYVDYVLADDGSGTTLAQLTLRLSDPSSPLCGREFQVMRCSRCPHWTQMLPALDSDDVSSLSG